MLGKSPIVDLDLSVGVFFFFSEAFSVFYFMGL